MLSAFIQLGPWCNRRPQLYDLPTLARRLQILPMLIGVSANAQRRREGHGKYILSGPNILDTAFATEPRCIILS